VSICPLASAVARMFYLIDGRAGTSVVVVLPAGVLAWSSVGARPDHCVMDAMRLCAGASGARPRSRSPSSELPRAGLRVSLLPAEASGG
jgi:hypothetical protein